MGEPQPREILDAEWRGKVDAEIHGLETSVDKLGTNVSLIFSTLTTLREDFAGIKASVRIGATLGGILGGALSSLIVGASLLLLSGR